MRRVIKIPNRLYKDETICFIADRYHTTTRQILKCFLLQEGIATGNDKEPETFQLEDNEMEILRGLTEIEHL